MPLASVKFKELLNSFEEDVREINDDLYQATKPATPAQKRQAILKTARKKLQEYDALLASLDGGQRRTAENDFSELMTDMRDSVAQLEKAS